MGTAVDITDTGIEETTGSSASLMELHRSSLVLLLEAITFLIPVTILYLLFVLIVGKDSSLINISSIIYRLIFIAVALEMIRRYFNDLYVFLPSRLIHQEGRISFRFRKISIRYSDICEIRVAQNILGRIFGYGNILIGTASSDTYEMTIKGIRYPKKVSRIIEDIRLKNLGEQTHQQEGD